MDEYKPAPDSQFRLRPCKCGSEDVAYQSFQGVFGTVHWVKCQNCGLQTSLCSCRHDAQVLWNREV